ncbi:MAG TPA: glycosyltransferase [Solirubrobacteraceae bacterium]|nr:glycosyltransferase [Solirubrobacteraceae bacterium]
MRVSVIVPTYRRPDSLRLCLLALARQQSGPDEILVVANSDDHASHEVVRTAPAPVRLVTTDRSGVVAKMNAGLDAAAGDLIVLTDDDSQPHPDWLERLVGTFDGDGQIAAVGGRDRLYFRGQPWRGPDQPVVGKVDSLGRVTGNHHTGVGPARDVDVLKGVNLGVRTELLRRVRFDERLVGVGTQTHWELALCLTLRRAGFRIIYDPEIAVDHHPQPRIDDSRQFGPAELRDAVHNRTLALLEYLPAGRRPLHLAWAMLVGTGVSPGLAQLVRRAPKGPRAAWRSFVATQTGILQGVRAYRACRHGHGQAQGTTTNIPSEIT